MHSDITSNLSTPSTDTVTNDTCASVLEAVPNVKYEGIFLVSAHQY